MEKRRVLYVSQEIQPFLPETEISKTVRNLPQGIQENGKEIRVFMPRYGVINERRHQLHEVIRLSGMNLIINDTDHPLIIKVASVPAAKMQVYFIDNEEYFKRKAVLKNQDDKFFDDNDERSIFFCRGVLETVKKLGWKPDVIHCNGFMTAMMPLYLKKMYGDDPHFTDTKVVYSIYEQGFDGTLDKDLVKKLKFDGFEDSDIELMKNPDMDALNKLAINLSDGVVAGSENLDQSILDYAKDSGATFMEYQGDSGNVEAYSEFYDTVIDTNSVLAD